MATQNNSIDNLSDVRPDAGTQGNVSPQTLPIRGEKRIIPSPVAPSDASIAFEAQYLGSGKKPPHTPLVTDNDFNISAAISPYVDYVVVRLNNRGLGGNGLADGNPAVYRFLINPSQIVVNRTTLDGQAFARSGWQIGVWGEDSLNISITGKTAGQYFAFGTTDRYQPFTESYRNLEMLQVVFENNGYWFEGEKAAEGPLGADFSRRIIKMHADVELIVGNFMWYGMFESLTVSQAADEPFLMNFQMTFIAWKERFRKGSPYSDTIHNDVKRGHDYGAWKPTAIAVQQAQQALGAVAVVALTPFPFAATTQPPPPPTSPQQFVAPAPPLTPVAPAVSTAQASYLLPAVDSTANDSVPMDNVLNAFLPPNLRFWNGTI
jgi:hypothetical protein